MCYTPIIDNKHIMIIINYWSISPVMNTDIEIIYNTLSRDKDVRFGANNISLNQIVI